MKHCFFALFSTISLVGVQAQIYQTGAGNGDPFTGWTHSIVCSGSPGASSSVQGTEIVFDIPTPTTDTSTYSLEAEINIPALASYTDVYFYTGISVPFYKAANVVTSLYVSADGVNYSLVSDDVAVKNVTYTNAGSTYVKVTQTGRLDSAKSFTIYFSGFKVFDNSSGLAPTAYDDFKLWSSGVNVFVSSPDPDVSTIEIYGLNGSCVFSMKISGEEKIDCRFLPGGIYMASLRTEGKVYFRKIVIQ